MTSMNALELDTVRKTYGEGWTVVVRPAGGPAR